MFLLKNIIYFTQLQSIFQLFQQILRIYRKLLQIFRTPTIYTHTANEAFFWTKFKFDFSALVVLLPDKNDMTRKNTIYRDYYHEYRYPRTVGICTTMKIKNINSWDVALIS